MEKTRWTVDIPVQRVDRRQDILGFEVLDGPIFGRKSASTIAIKS